MMPDKPCTGKLAEDRRSALCAQWVSADAAKDAAFWALLSALFTAASVVGLIGTLILALKSNKTARETADRQLRAYVSVQPLDLTFYHGDQVWGVEIKMRNGGATPAYDCVHGGNIVAFKPEDAAAKLQPRDDREQIGEPAPLVLHGGQESNGTITGSTPIAPDVLTKVKEGEYAIYVFGFVRYKDTFNKRRQSNFCYRVMDPGDPTELKSENGKIYSARLWRLEAFHNNAT
ncbi:MAG: hypothetical protein ACK4TC_11255 [Sphingomonas pseudosanguinis]|uniref:hypothetical protein n=1 Tax=Sphingomonas pseudosanguinis TaxID=413712 RepID=UPI00391AA62C